MSELKKSEVVDKYLSDGKKACSVWLIEKVKEFQVQMAHENSYISLCENIYSDYKSLKSLLTKKNGRLKYDNFMDSCVIFPKPLENKRKNDTVFGARNIDDIKMKGQAL